MLDFLSCAWRKFLKLKIKGDESTFIIEATQVRDTYEAEILGSPNTESIFTFVKE